MLFVTAAFVAFCGVPELAFGDSVAECGEECLAGSAQSPVIEGAAPSDGSAKEDPGAADEPSPDGAENTAEEGFAGGAADAETPADAPSPEVPADAPSPEVPEGAPVSEGVAGAADAAEAPALEPEEAPEAEVAADPAASAPDGWTVDGSGSIYYYENGAARTGWLVADTYLSYGMQRYWFDMDGRLVVGSLVDAGGGAWAYARPEGFVARGKYVASDGRVYLADNDGRLEGAGWCVTDAYDGGMQRYYVDASTHAAATGFFEADGSSYYGLPGDGRELRGAAAVGGDLVLADNDGRLLRRGWAVTDSYGQGLQRYWFEGFRAARSALVDAGGGAWAYARPEGFVARGKYVASDGRVYLADNDGRLEGAGWCVTDAYDGGMQRYYVDASTHAAATGFFEADGSSYYGLPGDGFVLREAYGYGKSWVLLADNDGQLASKEGWMVTGRYTSGSLQRYFVAAIDGRFFGAKVGFFTVDGYGKFYGLASRGYVARGKETYSKDRMLLADNEGRLVDAAAGSWLVTGLYDGGSLQRYRIEDCGEGYVGARLGLFVLDEDYYYGRDDEGFVVRGTWRPSVIRIYIANNEGHLAHAVKNATGGWTWIDENGRINRSQAIDIVVSTARSSLGIPYVWSGESPLDGGMDCSGLVYYCYKQLGIVLSRVTYDNMVGEGVEVSLADAQPGDLIFMYYSDRGPEHVVLYVGNGMVIEEPSFNMKCQYVSLASKYATRVQVKRIIA